MSQAPHSDLEVVPNQDALENQKHAYYASAPEPYQPNDDTDKVVYNTDIDEQPQPQQKTICGLRKKTFWILVIVAIVVVAAAIGGGVGGALATKSSKDRGADSAGAAQPSATPDSQSSSSTTPTPTSAQSSTIVSTTSIVGPSSTILRDCPSSNYTLYDVTLGNTKMSFRKACDISFLNANGIDSVVGRPVASLNDCINACALYNVNNMTQIQQGTSRICNSVCWRNTFDKVNDWPGGMCFGFTSQNSSGTFRYRMPPETRCDSAALINQEF